MPQKRSSNANTAQAMDGEADRKLAEKVAKRVYELWLEDLRRDRERRGKPGRR